MTTHIVTAGGGGFSMSSTGSVTPLDHFVLELADKPKPLVCFVPTASADDPRYINRFLTAYGAMGVRTMVCTLWRDAATSVSRLEEADVILVGGGSTVNLMALWDAHGVSRKIKDLAADSRNIVLAGTAAGGAAFYDGCVTDSFGDLRPWRGGVGLLPGSFCPHYNGEDTRQPIFVDAIGRGDLPPGYGVDDGAAIHYVDGVIKSYIADTVHTKVYRVEDSLSPTSSGVTVQPQKMKVV
ncbi:Type 1 glutamine amidotransferase-like domain-containing protein [Enemella sp. A6]|uniref:Type 1 glutamine amidotransferase-like domain-containing protein n=1 Tax=Enemella sp. A6 TaxID=3440152 RepID=UPI003EBE43B2